MDLSAFVCRQPGCGGPKSGFCINSLDFKECPDVVASDEAEAAESEHQSENADLQLPDAILTGGGASLDDATCDRLLRSTGATLVGVVAGPDVGKTTLIATMYELIHRGRMDAFGFAGSETLRGYEERCHLARMASMRSKPDTARTPVRSKLNFTHLRLGTCKGVMHVVFSDRSGEHFDSVLNRPGEIADFADLVRADVILILVDLERHAASPHKETSQLRRLFMAMDEADLLAEKVIRLVGTKADRVGTPDEVTQAEASLMELAQDLTRRSKSSVDVRPILTSSRRRVGSQGIGEGLEELMRQMLFNEILDPTFTVADVWPENISELDALMTPYREGKC